MNISFPDYSAIFENEVYHKEDLGTVNNQQVQVKHILILRRCRDITKDEVVSYLQQKAGEVDRVAALYIPVQHRTEKTQLEQMLINLPQPKRAHLINGDKNYLDFVRQNTTAVDIKDGESISNYTIVSHGLVPSDLISKNKENLNDSNLYDLLISDPRLMNTGFGLNWKITLQLCRGILPDRNDVEFLMKHGTEISKTLAMYGNLPYPEEAKKVLDCIYKGLDSKEKIAKIKDVSNMLLEYRALESANALHKLG